MLAAPREHWLYKDLEREAAYCHVPARRYSLCYARGLQFYNWNFGLGQWVAGMKQSALTAVPVSWELISAATPGSRGKQCKYSRLPVTAPEGTTLSKHASIFLSVVLLQQQSKTINAI